MFSMLNFYICNTVKFQTSMRRKKNFILFFTFIQLISFSQTNSKLNVEIEKLKNDNSLKHATWSVSVMSTKKDSVIAQYNSQLSLVPASTLKIVTTATALNILGSDFKFETKLQYDGTLDTITGILKGNLYIIGGGDPTLESENFKDKKDTLSITDKWAILLKSKGIKKIEGAVIADACMFDDNTIPSQWIWGDIGNYFGSGACGLTYHDNKYTIYFKSENANTNTSINKIFPNIEGLQLINKVVAGGNADSAFIYGSPYSYYRTVEGKIPANKNNYEVDGAIPDPALFCAQALAQSLKSIGINVLNKPTTVKILKENNKYNITNKTNIYTHYSPTLEKIVYWTNLKSINLYAEHLLKFIAYKKTGIGNEEKGIELITNYWKNKGIDVSGLYMQDGCGLSRANTITTKIETQILRLMANDKNFNAFYNSFPIAGKSSSLGNLCEGTFAENNMRAKSGYITRARGYAGYVKNKKGEMLCFSLLANNYECSPSEMKKKLEKILIAIAEME